jgi:hypothetical protein
MQAHFGTNCMQSIGRLERDDPHANLTVGLRLSPAMGNQEVLSGSVILVPNTTDPQFGSRIASIAHYVWLTTSLYVSIA